MMQSSNRSLVGNLRVTVERAMNLPQGIFGNAATNDPYLKLRIDNSNHVERGKVKEKAGNNPVFDEVFNFNLQGGERGINIEVWDETVIKNTELASVFLGINDLCNKSGQAERYRLSTTKGDPAGDIVIRADFDSNMQSGSSMLPQQQQQSYLNKDISQGQQQSYLNKDVQGQQQGQFGNRGQHEPTEPLSGLGERDASNVNRRNI